MRNAELVVLVDRARHCSRLTTGPAHDEHSFPFLVFFFYFLPFDSDYTCQATGICAHEQTRAIPFPRENRITFFLLFFSSFSWSFVYMYESEEGRRAEMKMRDLSIRNIFVSHVIWKIRYLPKVRDLASCTGIKRNGRQTATMNEWHQWAVHSNLSRNAPTSWTHLHCAV